MCAGGEGKQKQSYDEKLGFHACKDNKKNPFKTMMDRKALHLNDLAAPKPSALLDHDVV